MEKRPVPAKTVVTSDADDGGPTKGFQGETPGPANDAPAAAPAKKLGRFSLAAALHIILRSADALRHAHELGLVHRDVKPDNILLTAKGVVKVADLGLAKQTDEDQSMTRTGTGAGTPLFMAPEQA